AEVCAELDVPALLRDPLRYVAVRPDVWVPHLQIAMGEKHPVGGDAPSFASGNGPETVAAWRKNHGSSNHLAREERRRVAQLVLADLRILSDRRAGPALRETKSPEGILSVMSTALVTGGCGFVG